MSPGQSSSNFSTPPDDVFSTIPGKTVYTPTHTDFIDDNVSILPLNLNTNSRFQAYDGRTYESLPPQPSPTPSPPPPPPQKELQLASIQGFKSINSLPALHCRGAADAMERLVALKVFINSLQKKRDSYWTRQSVVTGSSVGLSFFTFGAAAIVGGVALAHQGDRIDAIKGKIRQAIQQINSLRAMYGDEERWHEAEALQRIKPDVFSFAIEREELGGPL